jgi:hypothetical protein
MTNRERYIIKRNEYDLMLTIADNISGIGTFCAIRAVCGRKRLCEYTQSKNGILMRDCPSCIQKFLNEESEE